MSFDPMSLWGKTMETWTKMADETTSRMSSFWSELEKADATRMERTSAAIDEVARLQKESLAYGARMAAELRKVSLDAMKQMSEAAKPTTAS